MEPENTITYRIEALEKDVASLRQQLERYVPARENDLQLTSIRSTVERIERDVQQAKSQLGDMSNKLVVQQTESERRDATQRESQAALQIKVLWGTVSMIIAILIAVLVGYITHFFH